MASKNLNRREFLRLSAWTSAGIALAACAPQAAAPQGAASPMPAATKAVTTPVTLTYIQHWHTKGNDAHYAAMDYVFNTWNKDHPDIQVQLQDFASADSMPKQKADCAAGDCPAIMHEADISKWNSGWLLDLTPYVTGAWKDRFVPTAFEPLTTDDGKLFALPMEYSPILMIYNKEIIEGELNSKVPTTWEEYMALGEAAKAKNLPLMGASNGWGWIVNNIIFATPGAAEALAKGQWDNDGTRKAATMTKEAVDKKFFLPNAGDMDYNTSMALFQQKKMVSFMDGAWTVGNNLTPAGADKYGLAKSLAIAPSLKFDGALGTVAFVYSGGVGLSAALAKDQNRLQAALKVMDFWTSTDTAFKWLELSGDPLGVKLDKFPESQPLASQFASAKPDLLYSAKKSGPVELAHIWDSNMEIYNPIFAGKSVDEAIKNFSDKMTQYKSTMS